MRNLSRYENLNYSSFYEWRVLERMWVLYLNRQISGLEPRTLSHRRENVWMSNAMKLQNKHCLGNWDTIWTAHIGKVIYVHAYLLLCIPSSSFFFVSFLFTGFAWLKSHLVLDCKQKKKCAEFAFLFCIHWGINFSICHPYFTGDSRCLKLYLALHFNFPALHCGTRRAKRRHYRKGFPSGSDGIESACNVGDLGSIPGLGGSPGGGHGNPLQYSCLEKPHKKLDTAEQLAHIGRAPSK